MGGGGPCGHTVINARPINFRLFIMPVNIIKSGLIFLLAVFNVYIQSSNSFKMLPLLDKGGHNIKIPKYSIHEF